MHLNQKNMDSKNLVKILKTYGFESFLIDLSYSATWKIADFDDFVKEVSNFWLRFSEATTDLYSDLGEQSSDFWITLQPPNLFSNSRSF